MGAIKKKHMFLAVVDKYIHHNIEWLVNISEEQRELLKNYLLNIDKTYRVDPESERSRIVRQGVRDIVEKIAVMIAERKPELKGRIIPKGSGHNGTKIGDSDEFDFVYQMDMDNFLKGHGTFNYRFGTIVCVDIIPKPDVCIPATKPSHYVFQKYFCKKVDGEDWYLNTFKIKLLFRKVLCEVLSELELPSGWCHGGFNRPHLSGLRFLGPSHVLQFDYLATSDIIPLCISVDFVPMMKVRNISSLPKPEPLQAFLKDETSLQYGWYSFHRKLGPALKDNYYGLAEELWLSKFPTQSTAKTAIRIFKILHRLVKASAAKYPSQLDVSKIDSYVKNTTTGTDKSCKLQFIVHKRTGFVHEQDDFISYSDLNETTGEDSILKSYYMKRVVLRMMSEDKESHGREWTDDDLPDLVISVYMSLQTSLINSRPPPPLPFAKKMSVKAFDTVFKEELSIHLKEIHEQREDKLCTLSHVEDSFHNYKEEISDLLENIDSEDELPVSHRFKNEPLITLPDAPKFYQLLSNSQLRQNTIGRMEPGLIAQSKISAIFQLLRAVCEGRSSVDIVMLGLKTKMNSSGLVQKTDFKELLYALNSPNSEFQKLKSVD